MTLEPGTRIGRYRIESLAGSGGMGEVYAAEDVTLRRRVALKRLLPDAARDLELRRRFQGEALAASALNHPNIVTVYDAGEDSSGLPFLAAEFVDGPTLRQRMRTARLTLNEVVDVTLQVASALGAAHAAGIVHRDVKPENVMLRADGWVKLLDFGLARKDGGVDGTDARAEARQLVGTTLYMSPEQIRGGAIDGRSDIWSLGVVLYEMAAGRQPFGGRTTSDVITSILGETPRPVPSLETSPELLRILTRMLEREPERRYASCRQLLVDLRAARGSAPGDVPLTAGIDTAEQTTARLLRPGSSSGRWTLMDAALGAAVAPPAPPLPSRSGPLLGREREIEAVEERLRDARVRLLTLSGPGGTGKTRLALEAAHRLAHAFEGVYFVSLASLAEPALVGSAIAQAIGAKDAGPLSGASSLVDFLRGRRVLLVLDNFEQVVGAAPLLSELLLGAPDTTALVTSRFLLHLSMEHELFVPPLPVPAAGDRAALPDLAAFPSVALFVGRARAVRADFQLTGENAAAVAEICRRLDGLPLALELAAARVKLLPPAAMLTRLESRLRLLTGGAADLSPRQRTMRATIEWGHQLLSEAERKLFRRLAVFSGDFTLEAAEAVAGEGLAGDVLDGIASLQDKSLLSPGDDTPEARSSMIETLREFGLEELERAGETVALRGRHARFLVALAEEAAPGLEAGEKAFLDRIDREHDNVRAALGWALRCGDAEVAERLAGALWRFWYLRGYYGEGRRWLESALELAGTEARVRTLLGAGAMAFLQCDYTRAEERLAASLARARAAGDADALALALQFAGSVARERGAYAEAVERHRESLEIRKRQGDERGVGRSLNYIGFAAWLRGDLDETRAVCAESAAIFRRLGDPEGTAWALLNLGAAAFHAGDAERARSLCRESFAFSTDVGFKEGIAWAFDVLGTLARHERRLERSGAMLRKSLELHRELGDKWRMSSVLYGLAALALAEGRADRSARLAGAADVLRESIGAPVPTIEQPAKESLMAGLRAVLGSGLDERLAEARLRPLAAGLDEALSGD